MNTLFMKILLWFGIMLALMFVGIIVITAIQIQEGQPRGPFQPLYAELAVEAWKQDGPEGLKRFLDRYSANSDADAYVVDKDNRDVLTGEVRAIPKPGASGPMWFPFFGRPPRGVRVIAVGEYKVLSQSRRQEGFAWWLVPQNLWILGVGILLCFLLAAYLSSPLRKIQVVVEQYGEGKLDLRLQSKRRDEFGKLARAFDAMADRIQTLLAAERRLLLDISHELRSPLARMSVAIELLEDADEREPAKAQIRRETERLNQLIGGLLEVTRAEGEPSLLQSKQVDIRALLLEIVQDCSFEARERNVEIAADLPNAIGVSGDSELLRRAIENVIRNALRYAPPHSHVAVECTVASGEVAIRVRDFGPGVPEEALGRLFDPFFRVEDDRNRRQGGTGLGLSIARRAIAVHGGSIVARNANPGLCVEIRLLVADVPKEV